MKRANKSRVIEGRGGQRSLLAKLDAPEIVIAHYAQRPQINPHLAKPPAIDALEVFLLREFLRRYVTYCARRR